jgi:hypothetical protein
MTRSRGRRHAGGTGATPEASAAPAASAPATAKQDRGGGTVAVPTTASASSPRLRNGTEEPNPQATCRADNAASTPPVMRAVIRIGFEGNPFLLSRRPWCLAGVPPPGC